MEPILAERTQQLVNIAVVLERIYRAPVTERMDSGAPQLKSHAINLKASQPKSAT